MATRMQNHISRITEGLAKAKIATDAPPVARRDNAARTPAPVSMMVFSDKFQQLEKQRGHAVRVPMDLCDEGAFHPTPIDAARVAKLVPNIKKNGQATPALVRPKDDGRYEILAGRHRKAALIELGEKDWEVVIRPFDDDIAERLTFYDNLMAPNYSDLERYLGFKRFKDKRGLTNRELAEESGYSPTTISRLMQYEELPQEAFELLKVKPQAMPLRLISEFASAAKADGPKVIEAIRSMVEGDVPAATALLTAKGRKIKAAANTQATPFYVNRKMMGSVVRRDKRIVIDLKDEQQVEELEKLVSEVVASFFQRQK